MKRTLVINVVGLSEKILGENTPFINTLIDQGHKRTIEHVWPAVTCSVQSTYLTGSAVNKHGIVGNGWYNREMSEVMFWKQSNKLVQGEMIWDKGKELNSNFTCAQLFWWYNMYNTADWSVTPRPLYPIDGRKIPDIYCSSEELRHTLNDELGQFPLFNFWGPNSNIKSSKWIAESAKYIEKKFRPTLNLVYLPHLDYCLQKYGPGGQEAKDCTKEIDLVVKDLVESISKEIEIIILSEYSISKVDTPIYPNRELKKLGLIKTKKEFDYEMLDTGASDAFAICDHQIAHIYINHDNCYNAVVEHFKSLVGVDKVLTKNELKEFNLDHERSGDIVIVSKNNSWFSYYYWVDDKKAPDYARTVDIHRKPGYDPVELFIDPKIKFPMLKIAGKLIKKKLGFRTNLDIIPLDANLVKGSHGAKPISNDKPVFISSKKTNNLEIKATHIKDEILNTIFSSSI